MATTAPNGSSPRRALAVGVAVLLLVGAVTAASASATYTLTVSNSVDGPAQEFTVEGETFGVSSLSYYERGEPIEASVTRSGGDGADYELLLYDSERRIEKDTRPQSGDGEFTFATDDLPAGTYVLVVDERDFEAVHPVVVQGYDVRFDTQTTVAAGESWTATADLDAYEDAPAVHSVEFVLLGEDTEERFRASETAEGSYEATVTAPDGTGEYSFGVIVRGTNEVEDGEREPIAVGEPVTLSVESGGSDGGDGADGGEGGEATATPADGTATATPDGDPETGMETETDSRSTDDPTPTGTADADGPITPAEPTATTDGPGDEAAGVDEQPGLGAGTALAALLATLALLAARR